MANAQVRSSDGRRVHFEGVLDDCKAFVERHFPRAHVEPGVNADVVPDVYVDDSGTKHVLVDGSWSNKEADTSQVGTVA